VTIYVAGDLRGIQEHIFASPRLAEMRGASAQIDLFDREVVPRLLGNRGTRIFSGGGNFLASFESDSAGRTAAEAFASEARTAFFDLTGTSGLVVACVDSNEGFGKAYAELGRRLRQRKRSGRAAQPAADLPHLKRCESCGREPADVFMPVLGGRGERHWLGPICFKKRRLHTLLATARKQTEPARLQVHGLSGQVEVPQVTPLLHDAKLPHDFLKLVGDDDLAIVVADGNGFGEWFEGIDDVDEFKKLSKRVDASLRDALDAAARDVFNYSPDKAFEPDLQILICGGDDLVVALPARHGMRFTQRLVETFAVEGPGKKTKRLSAGLVFSKPGFPFLQAHALAEALLHRAKRRCRKDGSDSALDFHRITASHVRSFEDELAAVERPRDAQHSKRWAYGLAGPYTTEEADVLVRLARDLRETVSPSQRSRLREILSPRDDEEATPPNERGIAHRVEAELKSWHARQVRGPFSKPLNEEAWRRYLRLEGPGPEGRTVQRFVLADALILAELGED
jgi:Cas10/Cmr2, second palm domain